MSVRTLIKNLHVDHGTFKRVTLTVHMCDIIDEERLDARKFIYTLKKCRIKFPDCPVTVP